MVEPQCTWCAVSATSDDRFEIYECGGERQAFFCRLEHIVPWAIKGARWETVQSAPETPQAATCSYCKGALGDSRIDLLRRRAGVIVDDAFCGVDHLASWAKAGGRYAKS